MLAKLVFLLALSVGHAFVINPRLGSSTKLRVAHKVLYSTTEESTEESFLTWQEKLEIVLDPRASLSEKQTLLQDLLKQSPEIRDAVLDAIDQDSVEKLLPPKGQSRFEPFAELIRATDAVRRQVVRDILPRVAEDGPRVAERLRAELEELRADPEKARRRMGDPEKLRETLRDPEKVREAVQSIITESKNIYSRTPEGLETPKYSVVQATPAYEVRSYEQYATAATAMDGAESMDDPFESGRGFNTLAGYLFGDNEAEEPMEMTIPVAISRAADGGRTMAFVLPSQYTPESAPAPKADANITVAQTKAGMMVAAVEFPGFATEGEIERQRVKLLEALEDAGEYEVKDPEAYTVLQYNPPYTLPVFRRNELTVEVRPVSAAREATAAAAAAAVEGVRAAAAEAVEEAEGAARDLMNAVDQAEGIAREVEETVDDLVDQYGDFIKETSKKYGGELPAPGTASEDDASLFSNQISLSEEQEQSSDDDDGKK
mmetsp:Transcript_37863/g.62311  ORF Transcript_37863/g.62311 Transcript_37863/m.62311 type:complete len:489 (-) Transcript_37863:554-2020(-)